MAADLIKVSRGMQAGNMIVRSADMFAEFRSNLVELIAIGSHGFEGSDYSAFEEQCGLEAGTGQEMLTLLNIMNDIVNTNLDKDGQLRLDQTNEFVARVANQ